MITPKQTPSFYFQREGKVVTCYIGPGPSMEEQGNKGTWFGFVRNCSSELEAEFLKDYFNDFNHQIIKHYFTEGFNTHKKKQTNYFL